MLKRVFPILLMVAIFLTACATPGTPTMAPEDVQNTAVAAAWTMVAATQMAIPTATPLPPTEIPSPTPMPTFTAVPIQELPTLLPPTLSNVSLPTATTAASSTDPCAGPLNMGEAGITSPIRVENFTNGSIQGSLLLLENSNKFAQCGYVTVPPVKKGATVTLQLPKGSWWIGVWITYKDGSSGFSSGNFENSLGMEDLMSLVVKDERISLK